MSPVGGAVDPNGGVTGTSCIATSSVGIMKRICFEGRVCGVVGVVGVAGGCSGVVLIGAPTGCRTPLLATLSVWRAHAFRGTVTISGSMGTLLRRKLLSDCLTHSLSSLSSRAMIAANARFFRDAASARPRAFSVQKTMSSSPITRGRYGKHSARKAKGPLGTPGPTPT
jgi:hypothetical protein